MLPAPFAEPEVERGPWERRARRARRWLGSVEPGQTHPGCRQVSGKAATGAATEWSGFGLGTAPQDVESLGRPHCVHHPGRRGSRQLGGPTVILCIHKLRENVFQEHRTLREKELEMGPKPSHSYRGKFGVEQDRMDKSAVGHEYQSKLSKCCLQVDSIWGFGGKFGVQLARVDQKHSAKLSRSWAMIVFSRTVTSVWKRPKCSSVRGEVQSVDTPQGTALPLLPATFSCRRPRTDSSVCVSSFPALMLQSEAI
ncbi:uncharacterized protein LOC122432093 isoform X3 [Cervus canadensis]|uniref:uncharacterized protein LOC122432093 isoform X3 n=1 Tax=Cervus canadensis TaxID=1574408 RepID=UPI001CA35908|nr:uncharacterized protein LOC122432093 isoform X3 [Cervus canadensis]